jgi:hypothetical protein
VLDVSIAKNTKYLSKVLNAGSNVFYAVHHQTGEIPEHENLTVHIDTASNTCTSLIINDYLKGRFQAWVIVAAFGDNMSQRAEGLCARSGYGEEQINKLRSLGICMNYNSYGSGLNDLFYHPAELHKLAVKYSSPFEFIESESEVFNIFTNACAADMVRALQIKPSYISEKAAIFIFPNKSGREEWVVWSGMSLLICTLIVHTLSLLKIKVG